MSDRSYNHYWAKDVVSEMHHDYRDDLAVDWVLRWMARYGRDPEENSVTSMSDEMLAEFQAYIAKRNLTSATPDRFRRDTTSAIPLQSSMFADDLSPSGGR
uniref:Uncharacterized protein n=1 Tax=viral metagenome TaxID=1070528 RepID=A0A6H1ZAH7_9ZZZZ